MPKLAIDQASARFGSNLVWFGKVRFGKVWFVMVGFGQVMFVMLWNVLECSGMF